MFEQRKKSTEISSLIATKKGFIVGFKGAGFINIYEVDKEFSISLADSIQCPPNVTEIVSLSMSFDKVYLALACKVADTFKPSAASD